MAETDTNTNMTVATTRDYWISPNALHIERNAMGNPDYIQASCISGAQMLVYIKDVISYDAGHNYRRWVLQASPTVFNTHTDKYVYVAIPRNETQNVATVVFPSELLDIYGKNEQQEQVGLEDYYYIFLQGILSSSGDNGTEQREWKTRVSYGYLSSDEAISAVGSETEWYKYSSVDEFVTFLKDITMKDGTKFRTLFANFINVLPKGFLSFDGQGSLNGIANSLTPDTNTDKIVTPDFVRNSAISKLHDDTALGRIDFRKGLYVVGNVIESLTLDGGFAGVESNNTSDSKIPTEKAVARAFLRKDINDTASYLIRFLKGLETGDGSWYFDETGNIVARDVTTKNLEVTGAAHFFQLIIDQVRSVGGMIVLSLASCNIAHVEYLADDGTTVQEGYSSDTAYFRCYFRADDNNTSTTNNFTPGDLAIRLTFNIGEGEHSNIGNIFYWRKVTYCSYSPLTYDFDRNGNKYYFVCLSNRPGEYADNSNAIPTIGDEIVQLGNWSDTERASAIVLSAYDDGWLDTEIKAPSIAQYVGVGMYEADRWNLAKCRYTWLARNSNQITGNLRVVTAEGTKDVKESIQGVETRMTEIEQTAEGISLKVERQQYRRNLLTGTSFALRDSGWTDHKAGNTQAIMATVADGQGRHAMHIADSVNGQYPGAEWNGVRLKAGTSYTMRMAWMVSTADWESFTSSGQNSGGFRVEIDLRGKDSTGAYTTVAIGRVWVSESTQKDTWKEIILSTGAMPEGYTEYQVMAFLGEDHASGYISGLMLEEGDTYSGWGLSADDRERTGGNMLDGCFRLNKTGNLYTTGGLSVVQEDPDLPGIRTNSGMNTSNLTLLSWSTGTLLTPGGDYIFSLWAKGSGDLRIYAFGGRCIAESADNGIVTWASSSAGDTFTVGSEWRRYWVKWHVMSTSNAPSFIYVVAQKGSDIQVTKPKLETGCEATQWTCDKQDSYKDEELYDRLLPTGIDLQNKVITLTADRTLVKTNSGETIAVFDSDGGVTAKKVRTEDYGYGHVEISGGTMEVFNGLGTRNMVIGEKDGYMVLSYYDNNGNFLYDLGPHGLTASGLAEASLAVTAYYKETAGTDYNWMLLDTATGEWTQTIGNLYATGAYAVAADALSAKIEGEGRNTALSWGTAESLYRYTAAKVNGTAVSDPDRNLTAELAEQANGKYFTSEIICDGTKLVNLATGLYVKQGVKSQLMPTDWSSYHPQYGVAAMYVSGGVQNGNVSYMVGQTTTKGSGQIEV